MCFKYRVELFLTSGDCADRQAKDRFKICFKYDNDKRSSTTDGFR